MNKISREKFSIRKYKLGATSVLLGTILAVGIFEPRTAQASESDNAESKITQDNQTESEQMTTSSEEFKHNQSITSDKQIPNNQMKTSEERFHDEMINNKVKQSEDSTQNGDDNAIEQQKTETLNTAIPKDSKQRKQENKEEVHEVEQEKQIEGPQELKESKELKEPEVQANYIQNNSNKQQEDINKEQSNHGIKPSNQQSKATNDGNAEVNKRQVTSQILKANNPVNENNQVQKGVDVSNKVIAKDDSQIISENVVNPHRGQRSQLKYNLAFEKGIKPGDYFDFNISNNVNTYGVSVRRKVPDIKNGSVVMATGQVLDNGSIRYTFTDFIKDKVNVTAQLSLNLFIDPKVVQKEGQQTITSTLNGKTISRRINVQYLNGTNHAGVSVNGAIEKIDKEENKFSHIAYINPQGNKIQSATIYGRITSGYTNNGVLPTVKVYEYIGNETMPQSVYGDTNNAKLWKDVTEDVKNNLQVGYSQYQLDFENLNKRYLIRYEGEYQNDAQNLNFQTNVSGYPEHNPYYAASATWNNGLVFYQNDANANGDDVIIENNDINWQEDTIPDEHGQNNGNQTIEEDTNQDKPIHQNGGHTPIDWDEQLPDEHGQNNGNQTIEEDTEQDKPIHQNGGHTPIDWDEQLPDEHGQNNGNQTIEEDTEQDKPIDQNGGHTPIDWEEDTIPDEHGQNNGNQTIEEDTNQDKPIDQNGGHTPIDWEEDTTPDEHGQNNGNQTIEEDTNQDKPIDQNGGHTPIDWEEDTIPDEHGQNNGNQTIEEDTNQDKPIDQNGGHTPIDWEEDTIPDEHSQNNGNQKIKEDTTSNNHNHANLEDNKQITDTKDQRMVVGSYQYISNNNINQNNVTTKVNNHNNNELSKTHKEIVKDDVKKTEQLPKTGNKEDKMTLFATLLAILGSAMLLKRNRNKA